MTLAAAAAALESALLAAAEAAAAALPATSAWAARPAGEGPAVADLGPGPAAVSIALAGGRRLVLATTSALGEAVRVDPGDLAGGLTPALLAAAAVLGVEPAGAPAEVPAGTALEPGPGEQGAAVLLLDGDLPAAVLVVTGPAAVPAPAAAATSPADHTFASLGDGPRGSARGAIDLLHEVEMGVTAELGRTRMLVRDILALTPGSVIELDRAAGAPIDVLVNGTLIARGEVVVIDEEFGIRITEVVGYDDGARR